MARQWQTALPLPIVTGFKQNRGMAEQPDPAAPKSLVQWAITPPQSYAVYLVALFLVAGLSFYVGSLKPNKPAGIGPPLVSVPVPRN
jgi:hypothetical protein